VIVARVYRPGGVEEVQPADISELTDDPSCLLWVHVTDPSEDDLGCIQEEFGLHPLAMEDIRERHQRPKLEHYPSHSFLVAYTADLAEVELFIGPTWVVSVSDTSWSTDGVQARFDRTRPDPPTPGFFVYVLLDELVDGYFDATDAAEDALEALEERIFAADDWQGSSPGVEVGYEQSVQREMFSARRRLLLFRRAVVPLRDVVGALLRREVAWVDDTTATHLQDVFDHVLRAVDLLDGQRELMGNAVDAHLAIMSNRMNRVMKMMTSWGAILLGSTLVAGIYGMNFEHMPELGWQLGYPFALGLMVLITVVGYRRFKSKDWL
jgi:magnesium transporter